MKDSVCFENNKAKIKCLLLANNIQKQNGFNIHYIGFVRLQKKTVNKRKLVSKCFLYCYGQRLIISYILN